MERSSTLYSNFTVLCSSKNVLNLNLTIPTFFIILETRDELETVESLNRRNSLKEEKAKVRERIRQAVLSSNNPATKNSESEIETNNLDPHCRT